MSMGSMPVGANDVRDVAAPFSSVLSTVVDQMQWLIGPLLNIIYRSFCRTAPSASSVRHSIDHSLDQLTVCHSTDMSEQPHFSFYDCLQSILMIMISSLEHATYGTCRLPLAFLNLTTCHLSNPTSINLI